MSQIDRRDFLRFMGVAAGATSVTVTGLSCLREPESLRVREEFNEAFDLLFEDANQNHFEFFTRTETAYGYRTQFENPLGKGTLILEKNIRPSNLLGADIEQLGARTIRIYAENFQVDEIVATWPGQSPLKFWPVEIFNAAEGYVAPTKMKKEDVQKFLAKVRIIVDSSNQKM